MTVAAVGLPGGIVSGLPTSSEGCRLVLVGEATFAGVVADGFDGAYGVVLDVPARERVGAFLANPKVAHVFSPSFSLGEQVRQTVDVVLGRAQAATSSLALGELAGRYDVRSSDGVESLRATVTQVAHAAGARGQALQHWLDSLMEAVSNALYDAPRIDGRAPYLTMTRRTPVTLEPSQAARVEVWHNRSSLAFAVTDPFGSFSLAHFQRYVGRGLSAPNTAPEDKPGGAGLGLVMMADRLERLLVFSRAGAETTVVGVAPKTYARGRTVSATVQFFEL